MSKFGSEVPEIRSGLPKSDENVRNRTAASKIGQKGPDSEENFRTRLLTFAKSEGTSKIVLICQIQLSLRTVRGV